jgi:predicted ArsR family transcriptional regulator
MLTKQLLDSTRGRIVTLLQRSVLTADELSSQLGLTPNAVRSQLTAMERDGVVQRAGTRPGATRPSLVFSLAPQVEQLLSRAYVPLLTQLVRVFAHELPKKQVEALLRRAGKDLAAELCGGRKPLGSLQSRVTFASRLLNDQLGAVTHVEHNGRYVIRGAGCPLSALTGKHPGVCLAMESLVSEVVGTRARECCERNGRPRCCFEVSSGIRWRRSTVTT